MGGETMMQVNRVDLCVETFGDPGDPAILLIGLSMLSWDDAFCARLASGPRFVVRYDLRDTGRSVSDEPGAPRYTLRDLVADAVGLLDALGQAGAHVVGFSAGGWIAQLLALDHPDRVTSLTLISTRPTAPGPADPDLPEHAPQLMASFAAAGQPDWTDRAAVIDHLVAGARRFAGARPFDARAARALAGRTVDRTRNMASSMNNLAFMDSGDRWRERLGHLAVPTLVIHGTQDPFFPFGNAEALAEEIPGARLVPLPQAGHELAPDDWDTVVPAILGHTAGG